MRILHAENKLLKNHFDFSYFIAPIFTLRGLYFVQLTLFINVEILIIITLSGLLINRLQLPCGSAFA
jgi:hypothetical protein